MRKGVDCIEGGLVKNSLDRFDEEIEASNLRNVER